MELKFAVLGLLISTATGLAPSLFPLRKGSTVAIVTPMGESTPARSLSYKEPIDLDSFGRLLQMHVDEGTDGLCVLGTTGEAAQMTMEERTSCIRKAVEVAKGKIPIMVGTGATDPLDTLTLTKQAKEEGADAALVVTPMYVKPTQAGLIDHFTTLANEIDFPIVLYNVPGRTGCDMVPETVATLAKHKNIVGIKEATGDVSRVKTLRELCGPDFLLYSGDDETGAEFVLEGGDGVVSVTSNIMPGVQSKIMEAALRKDRATVEALNKPLQKLHCDLFCQSNPIVPKWSLWRMGKIKTNNLRRPLGVLDSAFEERVESAMREANCQF